MRGIWGLVVSRAWIDVTQAAAVDYWGSFEGGGGGGLGTMCKGSRLCCAYTDSSRSGARSPPPLHPLRLFASSPHAFAELLIQYKQRVPSNTVCMHLKKQSRRVYRNSLF